MGDDSEGGAFAVGYGVYYFPAAVGAVSAGEEFGVAGLAGGSVDKDAAAFELQAGLREEAGVGGLPDGEDDGVGRDGELADWDE